MTRLIPVLLGPQNGTTDRVEDELFWTKQTVRKEKQSKGSADEKLETQTREEEESGQFVLEDEEEEDDERDPLNSSVPSTSRTNPTRQQQQEEVEDEDLPCLAERLISTLIKLLFVPELTLSSDLRSSDSIITYSIWYVLSFAEDSLLVNREYRCPSF